MSLEAIVWAWKQPVNDQGELLVLLALADFSNQDNECWPGYERLLNKTRIKSRATLAKKLDSLELSDFIQRQKRTLKTGGSKTTIYHVLTEPRVQKMNSPDSSDFDEPRVQIMNSPSTVNQLESNQSDISIVRKQTSAQEKTKSQEYSEDFKIWWKNYPDRQGEQGNKKSTYRKYESLIDNGYTVTDLISAAVRYQTYCQQTLKTGTEYVKQTTTFLNNPDNLSNPWTVNHENNKPAYSSSADKNQAFADAIFDAPGCEQLSAEEQASIFGERPVQDHGEALAGEVQEHVSGRPEGEESNGNTGGSQG